MTNQSKLSTSVFCAILTIALMVPAAVMGKKAQNDNKSVEAAITQLEMEGAKAEVAGDSSFAKRTLTDDYTEGTSWGAWMTKPDLMKSAADPAKNKVSKRELSDISVRTYGNDVAIATLRETYDRMINGEHRAKTILTTDTWVNQNGTWKLAASHSSQADQKIGD